MKELKIKRKSIWEKLMKTKSGQIPNPLRIGKTLGSFNVDKDGPQMRIDLKAIEEKAERISQVLGVKLTSEEVALFTFMHEMAHYRQWKEGRVTTKDFRDIKFKETARAKKLEVDADAEAVRFIEAQVDWADRWGGRRSLQAMVGAEKTLTLEQARDLGIIS
jgi:Zn-dependent peptidase ImmA (M78 family)